MDQGNYQNNIQDLPQLNNFRYENIFKMYQKEDDNNYFYNINKKIVIPTNLDPSQFITFPVRQRMPWTLASFYIYGTIELWWLLCLINNISNPITQPIAGSFILALRPNLVSQVINNIKSQLV